MSEEEIAKTVERGRKAAEAKRGGGRSGKARRGRAGSFPFKVEDGRTWREVESESGDGEKRRTWVSFASELHVEALTRDDEGEAWGRLLRVVDRDGVSHEIAIPMALLAGSGEGLRAQLLDLGLEIYPHRNARAWLLEFIATAEPEARARCVGRIGWHGERFILPGESIGAGGDEGERVILQLPERFDHPFRKAGSLEDWRATVAAVAVGNSRLLIALSAAFAASLLALTGDEGGGFHIRGGSSSGKSTTLIAAGSVWGGGGTGGYVKSWRTTDNGLEATAAMFCDVLLALDELGQLDGKAAANVAYMLAGGRGKTRAGREGQARKGQEWRVLFLSNGEIGLNDKMSEVGQRMAAGQGLRVLDLRADAGAGFGVFETLHGHATAADLAQAIKRAAAASYGWAGPAFVSRLAEDLPGARDGIASLRRAFVAAALPAGADGQVRRALDRFALVAAAGELASDLGLTGWPAGAAREAARRLFGEWLDGRGGIGASEVSEARRRIVEALEVYGQARFQRWELNGDRAVITPRLGFVQRHGDDDEDGRADRQATFYFLAEPLRELLKGLDFRAVIASLAAEGVFVLDKRGGPTRVHHVPNARQKFRLYEIAPGLFGREGEP